jgi:hypothetical protein
MPSCPECGTLIDDGNDCRRLFDALLLLERKCPAADHPTHFLAVSSYVLQHPISMQYNAAALRGVFDSVTEYLNGRASLDAIRRRVRATNHGPRRVARRAGEAPLAWNVAAWPLSVADVLAGGSSEFPQRVRAWAESIVAALTQHSELSR